MEKLTQFFNMIDKGEEYIGNHKKFYMFIATTFITIYTLIMTKPPSINFEIIMELAIVMVPIIAMMSALFDFISLKGR